MRDPNRIKSMLKLLERVWTKHPTLRLGQLIDNSAIHTPIFYIEDEELEKNLQAMEKQP